MKNPYSVWDSLHEQILSRQGQSPRRSYYPALQKRLAELAQAEDALRASEELQQLALRGADLAMWDWSIKTGNVHFDDRWKNMLGYAPDGVESSFQLWLDLLHPDDRERAQEIVDDHLAGRTPDFTQEFRLKHKDGHWVWILSRGKVIERSADGEPLRACGTHLDISPQKLAEEERRRLESRIQHAQKLESLGVLAGGIAHDFNNLLVSILGNADLALSDLPASAAVWPYLDEIRTAAKRASDLTSQMLAYSGKGQFVVESTNVNEIVTEIGHLLDVSIPKTVTVRHELAADLPAVVVDKTQVRQVVMNLVTNAADALDSRSGTIRIATGRIHADRSYLADSFLGEDLPEGDYVYLDVADTGCGMDVVTRERIFDPFYTTKEAGRGLGMAVVMGIVRGHRGSIRVSSEPEQGTTFRILLPASEVALPVMRAPKSSDQITVLPTSTILVVDDEESVRILAQRMLERAGARVVVARDGVEAVARYAQEGATIDVVLLDMTMARMDGMQAFRELRRLDPEVQVVLSSGYCKQDATNRFANEGLAGFIQKPYTLSALLGTVRSALP